ncbi:PIN domain-containing protein [Litoribacter populi]|uniref:PIN domain-containing protein n=1 Tax=Litoribacter populi TaxID=2598460 RepID=UPI00117D0688|nr:PIN domain-containing protein [Litoribacter populi]
MIEQIETNKIFLDTSIFIKENFFAGEKLKAFFKHAKISNIELIITPITLNECLANIEKSSSDANSSLKKIFKDLDTKCKILKNVVSLSSLFNLSDEFKYDEEVNVLKEQFVKQVDDHFTNIPINSEVTSKVINDYFNSKPPFKDLKKKHEFPDAFVLNSLDTWCKRIKEKIYVVTGDEDLISFESKYLIPVTKYDKLLEQVSFTFSDANMLPKVHDLLEEKEKEIVDKIIEEFTFEFPMDGFDNRNGYEYDVHILDKVEGYISEHFVLYFSDNTVSIELTVPINYSADVSYEDTSTGWYDKEDDIWYNVEKIETKIDGETILKVSKECNIELPGKPVEWDDWELKEISSGIPDSIYIE